jgi:hypothetical protein
MKVIGEEIVSGRSVKVGAKTYARLKELQADYPKLGIARLIAAAVLMARERKEDFREYVLKFLQSPEE